MSTENEENNKSMIKGLDKRFEYLGIALIVVVFLAVVVYGIVISIQYNFSSIFQKIFSLFGINSDSGNEILIISLILLSLITNIFLTSDLNFNITESEKNYLIISLIFISAIPLFILFFSSTGLSIFKLNMMQSKFNYGIIPLLIFLIANSSLELDNRSITDNSNQVSFLITVFTLILFLLSLYFKDLKSIFTIPGGLFIALMVMTLPLIDKFILNYIDFEEKQFFIFSGVIALVLFLIFAGVLFDFNSFPNLYNVIDNLRKDYFFSSSVIFYLILIALIPLLGTRYFLIEKDETTAEEQFTILKDVAIFVFPVVLLMLFGTNIFNSNNSGLGVMFYSIITIGFIFLYLYLITILSDDQKDLLNYISGLLIILAVVLFLALFVLMTGNFMASLEGVPGIIAYLIFYIPCLIIDLINFIRKEFSLVTPTVGIVFILEIFVILGYLYLPKLFNDMTQLSGIDLVKEPVILNQEVSLPGGEMFMIPKKNDNNLLGMSSKDKPRYNYAVSMWVYINTNASNNNAYANELNIFNYNNKPSVSYKINISGCSDKPTDIDENNRIFYPSGTKDGCVPDEVNLDNINGMTSNFIFKLSNIENNKDNTLKTVKVELPSQKWHFLVFNYNDNTVDVFINGNLHTSYTFVNEDRPTYDKINDIVKIGQKEGLEGVICNTKYHTKPLNKFEIVNTYNLLINNNPPINNL